VRHHWLPGLALLALLGCNEGTSPPSAAPTSMTTAAEPVTTTTVDEVAHPFAGPMASDLEGRLLDGGTFVVSTSFEGLCVLLGDVDLGCDSAGPVVGANAPHERPRFAIPHDAASTSDTVLAYAWLPEGAVDVVGIDRRGRELAADAVVNESVWALPLERGGRKPVRFDFYDESGEAVSSALAGPC
jgi:hypothetical protein